MKDPVKKFKDSLTKKKLPPPPEFLSTGSTLLNLACSGRIDGGFQAGYYYLLVGTSSSGKSFLSLTCFAEATLHPYFEGYRFIYDDVERGALMDKVRYFGEEAARKIELPSKQGASRTLEEFYWNLDDALEEGKPFIYVLDSMDSIPSVEDMASFKENKNAGRKGKEAQGTYGTSKAKRNSSDMRLMMGRLEESKSILIVIAQTRANIGFTSKFKPEVRSGGISLTFYATMELWTSIKERLQAKYKGHKIKNGIISQIRVKKNRIQGREPVVNIAIMDDSGIDDVGSMIDFLVEFKHWKFTGEEDSDAKMITAHDLSLSGKRETLINKVQTSNREGELRTIVQGVWKEIEDACRVERKRRY